MRSTKAKTTLTCASPFYFTASLRKFWGRAVERLAQPVVEALPVEDDLPASVHCPEGQDHGSPPPRASLN